VGIGAALPATDLRKYLKERKELIDSFFHAYFRKSGRPAVLQQAMLYSLFAGGKRIRPILALASYEACGGDAVDIVPYAATLELVHTYSLIHDDLPAMDNDDLRRGKPTNHKIYGEAIAILAGDALLTEAFSILSDPTLGNGANESRLLGASKEVAEASGMRGMVAGQVQDMLSENSEPDSDTLEFIHRCKTAALICGSVKLGAILFGGGESEVSAMTGYGNNIGLAFQVVDDILDIEGETEEMGKPKGSDEKKKKMTYPRLYGVERSREKARQLVDNAVASLSAFGERAEPLRGIARYLIERKS
jgi:geranylgeranyl diphosphate synthase type II